MPPLITDMPTLPAHRFSCSRLPCPPSYRLLGLFENQPASSNFCIGTEFTGNTECSSSNDRSMASCQLHRARRCKPKGCQNSQKAARTANAATRIADHRTARQWGLSSSLNATSKWKERTRKSNSTPRARGKSRRACPHLEIQVGIRPTCHTEPDATEQHLYRQILPIIPTVTSHSNRRNLPAQFMARAPICSISSATFWICRRSSRVPSR